MVRATAARVPHRPALVDGSSGGGVTYAELVRRADRVAALLAERGLGPGDVLALWLPNLPGVGRRRARRDARRRRGDRRQPGGHRPRARGPARRLRRHARRHPAPAMAARAPARATSIAIGEDLLAARGPVPSATRRDRAAALLERDDRAPQGRRRSPTATSRPPSASSRPALRLSERDTLVAVAPFAHVMGFVPEPRRPAGRRRDRRDDAALRPRRATSSWPSAHRATVLIGAPPLMRAAGRRRPTLPRRRADRLRRRAAGRRAPARGRARASRTPRSARAGA